MTTTIHNFILIDDDPLNNKIGSINLRKAMGQVEIKTFTEPEDALAFLENEYIKTVAPAIIFLDINMPTMNGWMFMEEYEKLSEEIKNNLSVYMLSSSIDPRDEEKAKQDQNIKGFLSKPLVPKLITSLLNV